jgi:hypothetical protein
VPPGTVIRSGPGSSSGSNVRLGGSDAKRAASSSGADLSSLTFTPPPSSGTRATQKLPASSPKAADGFGGIAIDTAAKPVATKPAAAKGSGSSGAVKGEKKSAGPGKGFLSLQPLGLPIGFWLVALVGIAAIIGLGIMVLNK